jgi:hypothetical protein
MNIFYAGDKLFWRSLPIAEWALFGRGRFWRPQQTVTELSGSGNRPAPYIEPRRISGLAIRKGYGGQTVNGA